MHCLSVISYRRQNFKDSGKLGRVLTSIQSTSTTTRYLQNEKLCKICFPSIFNPKTAGEKKKKKKSRGFTSNVS